MLFRKHVFAIYVRWLYNEFKMDFAYSHLRHKSKIKSLSGEGRKCGQLSIIISVIWMHEKKYNVKESIRCQRDKLWAWWSIMQSYKLVFMTSRCVFLWQTNVSLITWKYRINWTYIPLKQYRMYERPLIIYSLWPWFPFTLMNWRLWRLSGKYRSIIHLKSDVLIIPMQMLRWLFK